MSKYSHYKMKMMIIKIKFRVWRIQNRNFKNNYNKTVIKYRN